MQTLVTTGDIRKSEVRTKIPAVNRKEPAAKPASDVCECAIIRSENFSLYYGSKVGVKDITMEVYPRSVTAIIGPSGCGKSTFLRSINRMNNLIPRVRTEGRLAVDGHDVYDKRTNLVNLRQQVGMVFQKPNPSPKSIYTIVIVTHNMQQAARVSERAAFSCLGELIEYDRTCKIFGNPGKKETEDYVTGRFG